MIASSSSAEVDVGKLEGGRERVKLVMEDAVEVSLLLGVPRRWVSSPIAGLLSHPHSTLFLGAYRPSCGH